MITDIIAHRRPTIALSDSTGRPVTFASVVTGMPIEPKATGAGLASKQIPAAENGLKPGGAVEQPPEREGDEHRLRAPMVGEAADRVFDDLDLAGVPREPVHHDRRE